MNRYSKYDAFNNCFMNYEATDISLFFTNPLWLELNEYIKKACGAKPEISYNLYSEHRRWNVRYYLNDHVFCTLYPEKNNFTTLIDVGEQEEKAVRSLLPGFTSYVQDLYQNTISSALGRWLLVSVSDKNILHDIEKLLSIRITRNSVSSI